jgi:hypothetical protein
MSEIIRVKNLSVRVVTGDPSNDPYGQGFASILAEFETDEKELVEQLLDIRNKNAVTTIRCAMLEVTGRITNTNDMNRPMKFILSVENVLYHKPKQPWEK